MFCHIGTYIDTLYVGASHYVNWFVFDIGKVIAKSERETITNSCVTLKLDFSWIGLDTALFTGKEWIDFMEIFVVNETTIFVQCEASLTFNKTVACVLLCVVLVL